MLEEALECDCGGGKLIKSRSWVATGFPYWLKPWGSVLNMSEVAIPYACMNCGKVSFYLGNRKRVIRDYATLPEEEKRKLESD